MTTRPRLALPRLAALCASALLMATPVVAEADFIGEPDVYRFGGTYTREVAPTAQMCAQLCNRDAQCVAWSHGTVVADDARACELKSALGRAEPRPGFRSGIDAMFRQSAAPQSAPATAARRLTDSGLRARNSEVWEHYEPVSADIEIDELAGGRNSAAPAPRAALNRAPPARAKYAPRAMRLVIGERVSQTPAPNTSSSTDDSPSSIPANLRATSGQ